MKQLSEFKITTEITEHNITKFKSRYGSGREYKVGDILHYGLEKTGDNDWRLTTFVEDELGSIYKQIDELNIHTEFIQIEKI